MSIAEQSSEQPAAAPPARETIVLAVGPNQHGLRDQAHAAHGLTPPDPALAADVGVSIAVEV